MRLIHDPADLSPLKGCALVPTMGALHDGHASLILAAKRSGRPVVATVFVNPTQFGPSEDFARYPRTLDADCELAARAGANALFCPESDAIYPDGPKAARIAAAELALPPAATQPGLEDAYRPGHLAGVCQVVGRLFDMTRPQLGYFGEKDYQQLLVIRQVVLGSRRWDPLEIIGCPTIREQDGLAMSSRNRYLDAAAREKARVIPRAIAEARLALADISRPSATAIAAAEQSMVRTLSNAGLATDYAVIRDATTLCEPTSASTAMRGLIAARLGSTRLIDNSPVWESRVRD